ncbi:MAG: S8 family peptidase [Phycisphaerales bacterium]
MIKFSILPTAIAAALCVDALAMGLPDYPLVPGEAIIRTANPKALAVTLKALSAQFQGVGVIDQIDGRPIYLLSYGLAPNQHYHEVQLALNALVAQGTLTWSEMNYVGQTGEGNTDSLWLSGVGTSSSTFLDQYAVPLLGLNAAHKVSRGAGVVVSVIDTGIDASHSIFNGAVSPLGASFVPGSPSWSDVAEGTDSDNDGVVDEQFGHGTFVAGLIHLVAPDARILSARALDSDGRGNNFRIAQALAWSIDRGAHVVNMSLGETYHSIALEDVVLEASTKGIIVCGAAGNRNTEDPREYPACDPNAFGVSATNWTDHKAPFSNLETRLDFAAPGDSDIVGGIPVLERSIVGPVPGENFAVWEGTSFANAFVSGTVALIRSQRPDWPGETVTPPQVRNSVFSVLADSGDPIVITNPAHEGLLGRVRIAADAAVLENPPAAPIGDINCDGWVGAPDLATILDEWGPHDTIRRSDLNADGWVNSLDITILLSNW